MLMSSPRSRSISKARPNCYPKANVLAQLAPYKTASKESGASSARMSKTAHICICLRAADACHRKWLIVSEQAGVGHGSHAKTTYKRYHDGVEANLPLPKEGDKDSSTTGQSKKPLGTLEAEASEHDSTPKKRKKQGDDKQKGRSNLKSNEKIHDSRKKKVSNRKGKKSEEYVKETDEEDVA